MQRFKTQLKTAQYGVVEVWVHGFPEGGWVATPHGDQQFPVSQAPAAPEQPAETAEQAVEALRRALS